VAVAEEFVAQGARWIHLVDLDRAFGTGDNIEPMSRIAERMGSRVRLELGGGFRSLEMIRAGLDLGATRVVIGTAAATGVEFVPAALAAFGPERLAVGIDARAGLVAVRGWTETSELQATELARRIVGNGIRTVIYTDIDRDGMLRGPDLAGARALQRTGAQVIVSGGFSSAADIRDAVEAGLSGAIVGRALYEGRLTLPEALAAATRLSPQ
jgi:phosphoribosylformimino-5-aminoimidazole carboxamide ribotide isomerase